MKGRVSQVESFLYEVSENSSADSVGLAHCHWAFWKATSNQSPGGVTSCNKIKEHINFMCADALLPGK